MKFEKKGASGLVEHQLLKQLTSSEDWLFYYLDE